MYFYYLFFLLQLKIDNSLALSLYDAFSMKKSSDDMNTRPIALFNSIPFVPRPEFIPEKYSKSTRNYRSITQMPSILSSKNSYKQSKLFADPPSLIRDTSQLNLFDAAPDPLNKDFVMVHLPMPDPRNGPTSGPIVIPIMFGDFQIINDHFKFSSTVMLVRDGNDGKCDTIVDTGMAMYKNTIIGGLASHGVRPTDIENVVLTHGDVDNVGNLNLFLDANIYSSNRKIQRDSFFMQRVAPEFMSESSVQLPSRLLCNNTSIYLTPGYSSTDLSLVVRNVQNFGTIAIVGNLVLTEEDSANQQVWQQFAYNDEMRRLWDASRQEIFCLADYIVPGHGRMFRVNTEMKKASACDKRTASDLVVKKSSHYEH